VPPNNATTYCPPNGRSCFFVTSPSVSFSQARTTCSALQGYVVAYADAGEQLAVEQYFAVSSWPAACCPLHCSCPQPM
jgi:hypothetical protein